MSHRKHSQTSQFLWSVKNNGRESRRHFRIQSDLNTRLDFIFTFHEQIEQFLRIKSRDRHQTHQNSHLGVNNSLPEVRHQSNKRCVPFVRNFRECRCSRTHQNLSNSVLKRFHRFISNSQKCHRRSLFRYFVLERPGAL